MLRSLPLTPEIAPAFATFPCQDESHRPRRPCRPYVSECESNNKYLIINQRNGDWAVIHGPADHKARKVFHSPSFIWRANELGPVNMRELVAGKSKQAGLEMEKLKVCLSYYLED